MIEAIRTLFAAIAVSSALLVPPHAVAAVPESAVAIRFIPLADALQGATENTAQVDVGAVSAQTFGGIRTIVIRRRVAIQLGDRPTLSTARLSVAMNAEAAGGVVRVDGIPLSVTPRLIAPAHRIGTPVVHDIEVTIPAHVPAGPFLSSLQWTAESN